MLNSEENYEEDLIDMKSIPIDKRPNIGIQDMNKYKNGGLTVESFESNGALVYIPYGIYVDLFNAIDNGTVCIKHKIADLQKHKRNMSKLENQESLKSIIECDDFIIEALKKDMSILSSIYPLKKDV